MMLLLRELKGLRFRDIVASISRPLIAVSIMALCVIFVARVPGLDGWWLLITKILVGAATYSVSILALWWGFGTTFRCRVVSIGKSDALAKALRPYGPGGPVESNLEYA
jgi:hypothetical protein